MKNIFLNVVPKHFREMRLFYKIIICIVLLGVTLQNVNNRRDSRRLETNKIRTSAESAPCDSTSLSHSRLEEENISPARIRASTPDICDSSISIQSNNIEENYLKDYVSETEVS